MWYRNVGHVITVRPLPIGDVSETVESDAHPWAGKLRLVPWVSGPVRWSAVGSRLRVFANRKEPYVQNDGAVWQGNGVTTALDSRAAIEWRSVSITLNPILLYNQNSPFELADVGRANPYAYPWRTIDLPQRFGPDAFWTFDFGQSELAVDWKGARVSAGTNNLWWGPGIRNAIIMSNNAPGFFHTSLGTKGPIDIEIGNLEGQWIWGRLGQSDWFDPTVTDTDRFITGIVLGYSPTFLEGLTVGLTRVFQSLVPEDGVDAGEYFVVFQRLLKKGFASEANPEGQDERNQLLSLFARWALPRSGFEAYVEWARNDHAGDLNDFLLEPEHSQGYTLGFQKVTSLSSERMVAIRGELTHLEASATFRLRGRGTYYEHGLVSQGYTQKGQVIGAGIGPGGNAQHVAIDLYAPWGSAGTFVGRKVHDNDAFWVWAAATGPAYHRHHVTLDFGANALFFVNDFDLGGGLIVIREFNRYFYGPTGWNLNVSLTARWRPR